MAEWLLGAWWVVIAVLSGACLLVVCRFEIVVIGRICSTSRRIPIEKPPSRASPWGARFASPRRTSEPSPRVAVTPFLPVCIKSAVEGYYLKVVEIGIQKTVKNGARRTLQIQGRKRQALETGRISAIELPS
jgi:hypothetical protein